MLLSNFKLHIHSEHNCEKVSNTCNKNYFFFLDGYVVSLDGNSFQMQIYSCKTHDNAEVNYLLRPFPT